MNNFIEALTNENVMKEFTEAIAETIKSRNINELMTALESAAVVRSATSSTSQAGLRARLEVRFLREEIARRVALDR